MPALASCGDATGGIGAAPGSVTVLAAASLTDAFSEIADAFEAASPGVSVDVGFAGSSSLREQILAGAPADVFASANMSAMAEVLREGLATDPVVFATSTLRVAVPAGNPAAVRSLSDLARDDLLVGLCAEEVPCGSYARQALARAGVSPSVDTNEPNVRALLTKIGAGELDAGIVYTPDVISAGEAVEGIAIPEAHDVTASYLIAVVGQAGRDDGPTGAVELVEFVLGDVGQAVLREHGFGRP